LVAINISLNMRFMKRLPGASLRDDLLARRH